MNKVERAKFVQKILNKYFPHPRIPLDHTSTYTLLIAVLLSAQCTDARVNDITPILFAKAKTPAAMIKLSIAQIEKIIHPCGLSKAKSKAIWNLSKQLVEEHGGKVPGNFEDLEALPGIGHKSASVVMAHSFHKPALPVDTHIHRCAKRWGLSNGKNVVQTEKDLKALFPEKSWPKLHLQIIHFARTYCQARGHVVEECPICSGLKGSHTAS